MFLHWSYKPILRSLYVVETFYYDVSIVATVFIKNIIFRWRYIRTSNADDVKPSRLFLNPLGNFSKAENCDIDGLFHMGLEIVSRKETYLLFDV